MIELLYTLLTGHEANVSLSILPFLPALIGAAGSIGSSLIGAGAAGSKEEQARQLLNQQVEELKRLGVPEAEARIQALQQMQAIQQQQTEYDLMQEDPLLRQAQLDALAGLQGIVEGGGLTLQDQANLAKLQGDEAARERGAREAILQNAAARGQGGSGFELAAQLANQQGAAQRGAQASLNTAAQAQDRALQALMQRGQLGGEVRGQDFSQQARRAEAQDAINRFNAAQKGTMQQYKFDTESQLRQNQFANELAKQQALGNARIGQSSNLNMGSQIDRQTGAGIGQGLGQLGSSITNKLLEDEKKKQGF